jgi:hypothetical protein
MATVRSFQTMLNEYLPNKLLKEELIKRDWVLTNVQKDDSWYGGRLIVPFKAAGASSVRMGGLTAANDIAEDQYVRGFINDYKEAWGSMIFNHRDLMDHGGKIVEDTFLKILPDAVNDFMEYMKMVVSIQMGTGPAFARVTSDAGAATGLMVVDKIDRFVLGQKVILQDTNTAAAPYYVTAINVNTNTVTLSGTRGGAAADVSDYAVAQGAQFFTDGAQTEAFQSIRDALLSQANGGSANLHGVAKTAAPFLQAVNINGSSITATNILDKIFDGYTEVRQKAKGNARYVLMSYKHLGSILKLLDTRAEGQYQVSVEDKKASVFGWDEIVLKSVKGSLTMVGIQEWSDSEIVYLDKTSMTFRSNGFFKKRKNPEGQEYFEVRNSTGYQYVVDMCLFGELEITKPGHNGIIYGINY